MSYNHDIDGYVWLKNLNKENKFLTMDELHTLPGHLEMLASEEMNLSPLSLAPYLQIVHYSHNKFMLSKIKVK